MQAKFISNYLINLRKNTPFPRVFSYVNLSLLLAAVICFCPACDDANQNLQDIISSSEQTAQQLPLGDGLAVGATAPEFSLPDANGNIHSLSDYSGQKLVVVFYRMGT